jgi:hypothetical protein
VNALMEDVIATLPVTLRRVTPNPFPLGGPIATVRMPLKEAISTGDKLLHPKIQYNDTFNAAANIAGDVGESDVFGPDDREMSGTVVIEVDTIDPLSGEMTGRVRWRPHVSVLDTADFCPGNLGNPTLRRFTIPMSKLEAMGMTGDVPFTIDYNLELQERRFTATPFVGPLPPAPGPPPAPTPSPGPVDRFPRSGPAKTTGSRLRIRRGPSLQAEILGLLHERGTPIVVETQVRGDSVDGNDVWDKIDRGFVSDRFVAFD